MFSLYKKFKMTYLSQFYLYIYKPYMSTEIPSGNVLLITCLRWEVNFSVVIIIFISIYYCLTHDLIPIQTEIVVQFVSALKNSVNVYVLYFYEFSLRWFPPKAKSIPYEVKIFAETFNIQINFLLIFFL